jgi:hypothetical protein
VPSPAAAGTARAATDTDDFIIYDAATGAVFYDADGSNPAVQTQFAILLSGLGVTNNDFFVV